MQEYLDHTLYALLILLFICGKNREHIKNEIEVFFQITRIVLRKTYFTPIVITKDLKEISYSTKLYHYQSKMSFLI